LAWVLTLSVSIPLAAMQLAGGSDTTKNSTEAKTQQNPSPDSFIGADSVPVPIHMERPVYPDSAMKVGLEGSVWVQVLVDKAGNAADVRINKTSGHEFFDRSALDAAKKTTWKPAVQDGRKVAVWVKYEIVFQLKAEGSGTKSK
jgi:TonB family protein